MEKKILVSLLFVLIIVAGAFYYLNSKTPIVVDGGDLKIESTGENAQNEGAKSEGAEQNIKVFQPKSGDSVGLPLKVLGEARVFENQFIIRIKDKNGTIIKEQSVMAEPGETGEFNLFNKEINYGKPTTSEGTIEVFDYSAKDGSEIDKVVIPVKFSNVSNALNLKVYFGNEEKNPGAQDCSKVYPVTRRIASTKQQSEAAIGELLLGIDVGESAKGYFTSINMGVKLNKITVKDGVATVDFDEMLQAGVGGSCKVTAIRAQITETLKQFSTIKKVIISIDGKTEDILQP